MEENVLDQKALVSYLKAQSHVNPSVGFDLENSTLYDAAEVPRQSAILATCKADEALTTMLAPYVGPGVLSALVVGSKTSPTPSGVWLHGAEAMINLVATVGEHNKGESAVPNLVMDDAVSQAGSDGQAIEGFGAGVVLMLKICGALTATYDAQTIAHVGKLVHNNTMTAMQAARPVEGDASELETPESLVEGLLSSLLSPSADRKRTVHMNSNEPVLLINNASLSEIELRTIVTETIETLQRQWNIWPVRVYAGKFLESSSSRFSISLLNVTNTDIGGPSMIQLLDAPCEARGWLGYARREVWNGRELLAKEEKIAEKGPPPNETDVLEEEQTGSASPADSGTESTSAPSEHPEDVDADVLVAPGTDPESPVVDTGRAESTEESIAQEDQKQEEQNEPHEDVRKHFKADEAPIRHPSWEHPAESESLLDLIKSQASGIFKPREDAAGKNDATDTANDAQQSKATSEDEFVVV